VNDVVREEESAYMKSSCKRCGRCVSIWFALFSCPLRISRIRSQSTLLRRSRSISILDRVTQLSHSTLHHGQNLSKFYLFLYDDCTESVQRTTTGIHILDQFYPLAGSWQACAPLGRSSLQVASLPCHEAHPQYFGIWTW
jgi:hypothetical protein